MLKVNRDKTSYHYYVQKVWRDNDIVGMSGVCCETLFYWMAIFTPTSFPTRNSPWPHWLVHTPPWVTSDQQWGCRSHPGQICAPWTTPPWPSQGQSPARPKWDGSVPRRKWNCIWLLWIFCGIRTHRYTIIMIYFNDFYDNIVHFKGQHPPSCLLMFVG